MRLLLGLLCCARAFYVPGVAPIDFSKEEKVEIKGQGVHSAFLAIFFGLYKLEGPEKSVFDRKWNLVAFSNTGRNSGPNLFVTKMVIF